LMLLLFVEWLTRLEHVTGHEVSSCCGDGW
jgi:hypothetical protein